jgi:hypothetical protein
MKRPLPLFLITLVLLSLPAAGLTQEQTSVLLRAGQPLERQIGGASCERMAAWLESRLAPTTFSRRTAGPSTLSCTVHGDDGVR